MPDEFTPRMLTDTINMILPPSTIIKDRVFRDRRQAFAETVEMEIITGSRKISKFVARGREALVREKGGQSLVSFTIPSIREKKPFEAAKMLRTRPSSGRYVNAGELKKAMDAQVAFELQQFKDQFTRTDEVLCGQALMGRIDISTDDGDLYIDFGVPAANKITLAGQEKWSTSVNVNIPGHVDDWKILVSKSGFTPDLMILGTTAAKHLIANTKMQDLFKANNIRVGSLDLTGDANFIGSYGGITIMRDDETYVDASGATQNIIPVNAVIMLSTKAPFRFWNGPIDDIDAGLQPYPFFSKTWREQDPSIDWLLVASAPLPFIHNPNAMVIATVA